MRILVKIGGAQLSDPESRSQLASAIAGAKAAGHQLIVVHGGGDQIRDLTGKLGIEDRYHDGLRITDAATAEAVLMVLGGQVNRQLVAELGKHDVQATGLTGADGQTFSAAPLQSDQVDLGFVGSVHRVQSALVETLLTSDVVPVIATVAPLDADLDGKAEHFYNINADHCAGPLAEALGADTLLFLTNVTGVLDADQQRISKLNPQACAELRSSGVIHDGMIPKVEAALAAVAAHPGGNIKIAPAQGEDAILAALESNVGTAFTGDH